MWESWLLVFPCMVLSFFCGGSMPKLMEFMITFNSD